VPTGFRKRSILSNIDLKEDLDTVTQIIFQTFRTFSGLYYLFSRLLTVWLLLSDESFRVFSLNFSLAVFTFAHVADLDSTLTRQHNVG
jgi:hypothetical protein